MVGISDLFGLAACDDVSGLLLCFFINSFTYFFFIQIYKTSKTRDEFVLKKLLKKQRFNFTYNILKLILFFFFMTKDFEICKSLFQIVINLINFT